MTDVARNIARNVAPRIRALTLFLVGLLILQLISQYIHLQVPFAEFCLTATITSSLGGGCAKTQVFWTNFKVQSCQVIAKETPS